MKPELKAMWIAALRSGKYEQGTNALYSNGKYCCLGVLHELVTGTTPNRGWGDDSQEHLLGSEGERYAIHHALSELNDAGVPFDMIAGLIDCAL